MHATRHWDEIHVIAKTTLANGAALEHAAKFPGNETFGGAVGIYRYSGHLYILILLHKVVEEIAAVTFVVGNQNFHGLACQTAPESDLVDCPYLTRREQANPLQFLVGEVRLFLVAGALYVAQSRFLRDTAELRIWHAEQEGSSCLRDIFRDLIVHNIPLCRRDGHCVFFHTQDQRL